MVTIVPRPSASTAPGRTVGQIDIGTPGLPDSAGQLRRGAPRGRGRRGGVRGKRCALKPVHEGVGVLPGRVNA